MVLGNTYPHIACDCEITIYDADLCLFFYLNLWSCLFTNSVQKLLLIIEIPGWNFATFEFLQSLLYIQDYIFLRVEMSD